MRSFKRPIRTFCVGTLSIKTLKACNSRQREKSQVFTWPPATNSRITAVADVYDALRSRRVYKDTVTHEKATAIIIEGRGSHFDPDVVDVFLAPQDEFRSIAKQCSDTGEDAGDNHG